MPVSKKLVVLGLPHHAPAIGMGIADYVQTHERWIVEANASWASELLPETWRVWPGHGGILQLQSPDPIQAITQGRKPVVSVSELGWDDQLPTVRPDNRAIGRLGAGHLLDKGYKSMVFYGNDALLFSRERHRGFAEYCRQKGVTHAYLDTRTLPAHEDGTARAAAIFQWLRSRPGPVAAMGAGDLYASELSRVCLRMDADVPGEFAILGVNNDEFACVIDYVPLSSIDPDFRRVGYEAARVLNGQMTGLSMPSGVLLIPPRGVVARRSTDAIAVDHPSLRKAIRFVAEHYAEDIAVPDVARRAGISRSGLDQLFKKHLRKTPAELLLRTRVMRAQELLRDSELNMPEVSERSGFGNQKHLWWAFKKVLKMTPSEYRRMARGG